ITRPRPPTSPLFPYTTLFRSLVVDMPPGTGDISISLGQLLPKAEVVVVTTPQKLAQDVASRAASMARKTNMRLAGVIENMSGDRSEEHTSELQSQSNLVCRLL